MECTHIGGSILHVYSVLDDFTHQFFIRDELCAFSAQNFTSTHIRIVHQ